MRQTLLFIPHSVGPLPIFGFGWAALIWILFSIGLLYYLIRRQGFNKDTQSYLPVLGGILVAILFVLPRLEEVVDGSAIGLPIRGYGVMMLIGVVSGVGLAAHRAQRMGLDPEHIFTLAFWMFICGIAGARAFFVIQKWESFPHDNLRDTLFAVVNVAQGGLVVYGSLIGGLAAAAVVVYRRKLPALAIADLIAPSLFLGLAFGRIGCMFNGCCFGGPCDASWAVRFPESSPPYERQRLLGQLHGFRLSKDTEGWPIVKDVYPDTLAATSGLKAGSKLVAINGVPLKTDAGYEDLPWRMAQGVLFETKERIELVTDQGRFRWELENMPDYSRPVHPTQIYSAINATVMFLLLLAYYPFRRHDGELIVLTLALYAVTRFLLEVIRTDEGAIFGTGLTISQNVSIITLLLATALGVYVWRQPVGSALPMNANSNPT